MLVAENLIREVGVTYAKSRKTFGSPVVFLYLSVLTLVEAGSTR
jgi:hypothetical protein